MPSRRIDSRLTLAAHRAAGVARQLPPECIYHSDRGGQYAADLYRQALADLGFRASTGRLGNPYDNAQGREFHEDAEMRARLSQRISNLCGGVEGVPEFIDQVCNTRRLHSALAYLPPVHFGERHTRQLVQSRA
jgi:putative transposase